MRKVTQVFAFFEKFLHFAYMVKVDIGESVSCQVLCFSGSGVRIKKKETGANQFHLIIAFYGDWVI